jgi:RNA polymerase sigma-70 factor (ECF subfamily)
MTDLAVLSQSPVGMEDVLEREVVCEARDTREAIAPLDDDAARALSAVNEAHLDYVWRSLRRLGVPEREREDLCHDVFVAFQRTRARFDGERPIRPWLFGICYRVVSDWRRRASTRREVLDDEPIDHADRRCERPVGEEAIEARERRRLVEIGLAALDLDKRAVLVLHDVDGCSMPEIAEALGVPLNTLYSRLRIARQRFADAVRAKVGGKQP